MSFIEDHVFLKATKFHKVGEVELPKYGLENNLDFCAAVFYIHPEHKMFVYCSMFITNSMDIRCGWKTAVLLLLKTTFW